MERTRLYSLFLTPFYSLLNELPVLFYIVQVDLSTCTLSLSFAEADLRAARGFRFEQEKIRESSSCGIFVTIVLSNLARDSNYNQIKVDMFSEKKNLRHSKARFSSQEDRILKF